MEKRLTRDEAEALKRRVIERLTMPELPVTVLDSVPDFADERHCISVTVKPFTHPFDPTDQTHYVEVRFCLAFCQRTIDVMTEVVRRLENQFKLKMFFDERVHVVYGEQS
ncbi:MAG: hypothetical protein V1738_06515 [Patescibacteria group bacterium]